MGLYKPPGIAETLDWAQALHLMGSDELEPGQVWYSLVMHLDQEPLDAASERIKRLPWLRDQPQQLHRPRRCLAHRSVPSLVLVHRSDGTDRGRVALGVAFVARCGGP